MPSSAGRSRRPPRRPAERRSTTGTGAVIRPDIVRAYAAEAGFSRVDVLPIEHDFWRFYRPSP